MEKQYPTLSLEERVARLEGALGWTRHSVPLGDSMFYAAAGCAIVACVLSFIGLGTPNHFYQIVFAVLTVVLAYHQNWLAVPQRTMYWALAALNVVFLSMLFKLLIGSGTVSPFFWAQLPVIEAVKGEGSFTVPVPQLRWVPTAFSAWTVDLTIVQTFLLLVTLVGALFEFQPFASLTAFVLVLVSLPALVGFDWPWVFPAVITGAIALYLQSSDANAAEDPPT